MEDEITCPHCGYNYEDAWELELDDNWWTKIKCESCGVPFECIKSVEYKVKPGGRNVKTIDR